MIEYELAIVGYTKNYTQMFFESIVLAYLESNKFIYCGESKGEFSLEQVRELCSKFKNLITPCPTAVIVPNGRLQSIFWIRPSLVCLVEDAEEINDQNIKLYNFKKLILKN